MRLLTLLLQYRLFTNLEIGYFQVDRLFSNASYNVKLIE